MITAAMVPAPNLPLLRLQIKMQVMHDVDLPPCRGSLWKSVLGPQLVRQDSESGDQLNLYRLLFEPSPEDSLLKPARAERPSPLVFDMPGQMIETGAGSWEMVATQVLQGEELQFGLTLVGQAADHAVDVIHALSDAAVEGIGSNDREGRRGTARLTGISHYQPNGMQRRLALDGDWDDFESLMAAPVACPALPRKPITIAIATPLRFEVSRGNGHGKEVVLPHELTAPHLAAAVVRRVSNLAACHCGTDIPLDGLRSALQGLEFLDTHLGFADQSRYSRRQDQRVPVGGIVGQVSLDLSNHPWLWPYLFLAQFVHCGKGALMGQGALRILPH